MKHKSLTKADLAESAGGVDGAMASMASMITAAKGQIESAGCR
jgi:hypothetical protein